MAEHNYNGLTAEQETSMLGQPEPEEWEELGDDGFPVGENTELARLESLAEALLNEQRETNKLLREFADSINQIGSMFGGADGKPVSPTSMITKALFGR